MHDRNATQSQTSAWEQVITVVVTLVAAVFAVAVGAADKWLTAIFVTVVTFGGMISHFRGRWSFRRFWAIIAVAFALHLGLMWLVFGVILRKKYDVGLLITLPGILAECFILYHVVRFLDSEPDL